MTKKNFKNTSVISEKIRNLDKDRVPMQKIPEKIFTSCKSVKEKLECEKNSRRKFSSRKIFQKIVRISRKILKKNLQ